MKTEKKPGGYNVTDIEKNRQMSRIVSILVITLAAVILPLASCAALAGEQPGGSPAPGATITLPEQTEPAQTEYCARYEEQETSWKKHRAARDDDWDDWDDWEEEEDPFGNIMDTLTIEFVGSNGMLTDTENGTSLHFELNTKVGDKDNKYADPAEIVKSAWVYITMDSGNNWEKLTLGKISLEETAEYRQNNDEHSYEVPDSHGSKKIKTIYERWSGELSIESPGPETRIIYFFAAEAANGNRTVEIPVSAPGRPPDPAAFFPAVEDMDNSSDMVYDSMDILDSFVAFDGVNLYLISRMQGKITPGEMDPPFLNIYDIKFNDPKIHEHEGLMTGRHQIYSPLSLYPYKLLDMELAFKEKPGRIADFCSSYFPFDFSSDARISSVDNILYYRTPLKSICSEPCDTLRTIIMTYANASTDSFMPIPQNASPFLQLYFRSHTIGNGPSGIVKGTGVAALEKPENLIPANDLFWKQRPIDADKIESSRKEYETAMKERFGITVDEIGTDHTSNIFQGKGPFRITPCDIVIYENYYLEAYTRNNRMKLRIFEDGTLVHTIMIGNDTKPRRDEQHIVGRDRIVLSDFKQYPLSCNIEIR
ncbi:MAG TPA: hypothetical protein PLN69_09270 [bacterium]|nr:hypothetical protein [bacterium]